MAGTGLKVPEKRLGGHQSNLGSVSCSWPGGLWSCSSSVVRGKPWENRRFL